VRPLTTRQKIRQSLAIIGTAVLLIGGGELIAACGSDYSYHPSTDDGDPGNIVKTANDICNANGTDQPGIKAYSVGDEYDVVVCNDGIAHSLTY
jgi:hypothetical protein